VERTRAERAKLEAREGPEGIFRTTLTYHEASMLCHFTLRKGSHVPPHAHPAAQHGYVLGGRLRFLFEDGSSFIAAPGCSYILESNQKHGAEVLEDSEVLEFFVPARLEYADNG
jgi:quercetin dioxygenase-like cupin family protein